MKQVYALQGEIDTLRFQMLSWRGVAKAARAHAAAWERELLQSEPHRRARQAEAELAVLRDEVGLDRALHAELRDHAATLVDAADRVRRITRFWPTPTRTPPPAAPLTRWPGPPNCR